MLKTKYVSGGFNKWRIGFDPSTGAICIDGYRQPISIEIGLGDVSTEDLKNIADMFNSFVPKSRAKSKAKPYAKK